MKKLMTMMGAVAMSFGLFADAWDSVEYSADIRDEGATEIVGVDDDGKGTDAIHWWIDGFEAGTIAQPAAVSNDTVVGNYLKVETDKGSPMLRTLNEVEIKEVEEVKEASYAPVDITAHGLFIDTKVRMTGTEDAPAIDAQNKNKLLVWLQTIDADETEGIEGSTNLMVTCGYVDEFNKITPTNYVLNVDDINVGDWVRLTIRADQGEMNVPAFKIFVDGEQVTGDDGSAEGLAVFPSLVGGETTDLALAAAGFDGTGDINYVNLLSENDAPAFAADPTYLTIKWNEGVASFTVGEQTIEVTDAGSTQIVVAAGSAIVTPAFVQTPAYKLAGFKLDGDDLPDVSGTAQFNIPLYGNPELEIAAVQDRIGANLVVDGETVGDFAFVKDAVAALAKMSYTAATITVKESETIDDFGNWEVLAGTTTLDLNGKTITVDDTKTWAGSNDSGSWGPCMIWNTAGIIIKDSVGGGQLIGSEDVAILANDGVAELCAADTDIVYDGNIFSYNDGATMYGQMTIEGGKFRPQPYLQGEGNGLAEGLDWSDEDPDGFYTVIEAADYVAQIGANKYKTLAEAVAAVGANETIELLANCASVGIKVPSGKNFTIDFAGKTVTFNKPGAGSKNTQTQAFQLLQGSTIVFKNGTICCSAENKDMTWGSKDAEKGIAMIIQNYANLTLENMTIDAANIAHNGAATCYAMSNNSGDVVLDGTTITVVDGDFAFDTCKFKTYALPTVEVKGDSTIDGNISLGGGNLTLTAGTLNGELVDEGIGNGLITKADGFTAAAPAGYKWDEQTGILIPCDYVAQIGDNKYESLAAAVAAAKTGDTITLLKSCSGAGVALWAKDQKTITIDLGGFIYTCVEPPVGSSGTQNQAFHFEQGNTVVIKNGTLTTVQDSAAFRFVIQNYADLTLDGVTVDGSKLAITGRARYTLSNNCGTVALGNGTALIASTVADGQGAFAMDTCKYASYALPTVTINGVTITGDIELGGGNLTLTAGTLNGALVDGGIGEGTITKAAGFTAAAPAGYKWDENGKLVKDEGKEIKPGEIATDIVADDEAGALAQVTIKPINDEAEAAGQGAVIKGKATQDPESGKWTVEPVIDEDAEAFKEPDLVVETTLEQIVAGTDGEEVTVELPAAKVTPGLYYSVDVSIELGEKADFVEGAHVLATSEGVSLTVTKPEGGKAFFKVSEHMAPTPANVGTQD